MSVGPPSEGFCSEHRLHRLPCSRCAAEGRLPADVLTLSPPKITEDQRETEWIKAASQTMITLRDELTQAKEQIGIEHRSFVETSDTLGEANREIERLTTLHWKHCGLEHCPERDRSK